ncbi:MAG: efflux RND transporter periplasmic adaptor subunit, partial [Polyangiaceae bacterium]
QGLAVGDLLVVIGQQALSDGASVKITDRTTLETFDAGAPAASAAPPVNASSAPGSRSSAPASQ